MTTRDRLRLLLIALGTAIVPLDTAVNVAFPAITRHFDLALPAIQWVVICYILTHASLMLAFGRVGDLLGHGRVFRAGLAASAGAYLLCGFAPTYGALLFCRFLQGIGAGLVISCAPALVAGLFPESERSRAAGMFTMIFALASAAGPLLGGALVALWGWPAVFWFRVPVALVALLAPAGPPPALRPTRERLDVFGAALLALGLAALLLALNRLQAAAAREALALGFAALICLAGFVCWERRVASPVIDLGVFRSPGFAAANVANVIVNLAAFAVLLFVPYFLARFTPLPVTASGAVLAAAFVGSVAVAPLGGRLLGRLRPAPLALAGALLLGVGLALVGAWRPGAPAALLVGPLLLQGVGLGLFQVAYLDLVLARLPRGQRGIAGSLAMLTRTLGIVAGAALLTLLYGAFESSALAAGAVPSEAFLAAFAATFRFAGLAAAVAGLAVLLPGRRE